MPVGASKLDQLGLDDSDYKRLTSWTAEIAIELSPGVKVRRGENEVRIGRKGSLAIHGDGHWYSFEADEGGHDVRSLIEFLRPGIEPVELRQFAITWLRTHPGAGGSGSFSNTDSRDRDAEHADLCRQVLPRMEATKGTLGQAYLESRGLPGDQPLGLVGYVEDDDRPGAGAIVGVISDANGIPAGIQLGYIDSTGRKVELGGASRRQFFLRREAPGLAFRIMPATVDASLPLFVTEGLENALSLAAAYPTAEVIGLPGIGRMKRLLPFIGRDIVVFRDGDAPDSSASRTLMVGVDHLLIGGASVKVTDTPIDADANSILQEGGIKAIHALVEGAVAAVLSPQGMVKKLAALHDFDYQLVRREHGKKLGIKLSALDDQVNRERARRRGDVEDSGEDPNIHPEPVDDIAAVLDEARKEVGQYVVADPLQLDMATVWSLHTHFVHHPTIDIAISPRLLISAPTPGCGKTTFLEAAGELAWKPLEISSISAAAFFRLNDAERPTLLIDEIQGMLGRKSNGNEMEAILNASHRRRTAKTIRVEEQANKKLVSTMFDSWGTFAATINGRMSYALESRCLKVKMRRALPGEVSKHLTHGTSDVLAECRRKFARWARDQLALPEVPIPEVLSNRHGDNWRPLYKIAALVGGHWPAKIEAAAMAAMKLTVSPDVVIAFLIDAKKVIGERERLLTTELIDALRSLEEPSWDWNACYRGGPINAYWLRDTLADVLDPPGAREWKVGGKTRNGYFAHQFKDAYKRYLQTHNLNEQGSSEGQPAENNRADRPESGKASHPSATGTKNPTQEQEISSVADAAEAITPYRHPRPEMPQKVGDADRGVTHYSASATGKISSREQEKTVPVADGWDQKRKSPISRSHTPNPPPEPLSPQPKGEEIDELW